MTNPNTGASQSTRCLCCSCTSSSRLSFWQYQMLSEGEVGGTDRYQCPLMRLHRDTVRWWWSKCILKSAKFPLHNTKCMWDRCMRGRQCFHPVFSLKTLKHFNYTKTVIDVTFLWHVVLYKTLTSTDIIEVISKHQSANFVVILSESSLFWHDSETKESDVRFTTREISIIQTLYNKKHS